MLACACVLISTPALAEVMDKEMSLAGVWAWGLGGAVVVFLVGRFLHWSLAVLCLLPASLMPCAVLTEVHDPHVGPAILMPTGEHNTKDKLTLKIDRINEDQVQLTVKSQPGIWPVVWDNNSNFMNVRKITTYIEQHVN